MSEMPIPGGSRRSDDSLVAVIATRLETLHTDLLDLKKSHVKMADALIKLALIEERQATFLSAQERMFSIVARLEARLDEVEKLSPKNSYSQEIVSQSLKDISSRIAALEKDVPRNSLVTNWALTAMGAAITSAVGYIFLNK